MKRLFLTATTAILTLTFISSASAADYKIDDTHSQIIFSVKHLGISNVKGDFAELGGSFSFDPEKVAESSVKANIKAASISTRNKKRDNHLRNSDFLAVDKFPEISFESTEVKPAGEGKFQIVGNLEIRGVSKQVTLDAELTGVAKDPWGNEKAAFVASTTLNRMDFGVSYNKALEAGGLLIGEEVKVELEIQGTKQ